LSVWHIGIDIARAPLPEAEEVSDFFLASVVSDVLDLIDNESAKLAQGGVHARLGAHVYDCGGHDGL